MPQVGPWPAPPPPGRGALWLDGSLASAVAAGWLEAHGRDWVALTEPRGMALAGHYGRPITEASFPAGPSDPGSVATAARFALEAGADWLVLPLAGPDEDHGVPLALRLVELEGAISRWGLPSLVAPLLRRDWRELGRLAVAFDVPVALSTDCDRADGCVRCRGRARALAAAGLPR